MYVFIFDSSISGSIAHMADRRTNEQRDRHTDRWKTNAR